MMLLKPHLGILVLLVLICLIFEAFQEEKSGYDVAAGAALLLWFTIEAFIWVIYYFLSSEECNHVFYFAT